MTVCKPHRELLLHRAKTPRVRLKTPMPDAGLIGWLKSYANKNFWRVDDFMEFDDLEQEGYVAYCICINRYGQALDPPHFMALFKTTFFRRVIDLANQSTKQRVVITEADLWQGDEETTSFFDNLASTEQESDLSSIVRIIMDAPAAIRAVLELFVTDTDNKAGGAYRHRVDGSRETTNEFLCRITKQDASKLDLVSATKQYLRLADALG